MNTQQLKERYAVPEIPKCRVCGGALTVQRTGGRPTIWGCTGMIDDPTGERNWIYAEGRSCADEHYERSRWSDYRQGGDADVIELIDALEAAERERDEEIAAHRKHAASLIADRGLLRERAEVAEAELARRDAEVSEPVGFIHPCTLFTFGKSSGAIFKEETRNYNMPVYTAASPAVLPPEKITEIMQDAWNEFCDDTGCYPDDFEYQNEQLFFDAGRWAMLVAEKISSLGAQQQKVVAWHNYQWRETPKGWTWWLSESFAPEKKSGDGWKSIAVYLSEEPPAGAEGLQHSTRPMLNGS